MATVLNNSLRTIFFSYSFFYFADSLIVPLFALFTTNIGGGLEIVGILFGLRTFVSALTGIIASRVHDYKNLNSLFVKINLGARAIVWIMLAFYVNLPVFIIAQIVIGITDGIGTPAFNSLVSTNLNKNKTIGGWAIWHIMGSLSIALANAAGAFIVAYSSFQTMFILMSAIAFGSFCILQLYDSFHSDGLPLRTHLLQTRSSLALAGIAVFTVLTLSISFMVYTNTYTVDSDASEYTGRNYQEPLQPQPEPATGQQLMVACLSPTQAQIRMLFSPEYQFYTLYLDVDDGVPLQECELTAASVCDGTSIFSQYDCFINQIGEKCISLTNPEVGYSVQIYETEVRPRTPYTLRVETNSGDNPYKDVTFTCR